MICIGPCCIPVSALFPLLLLLLKPVLSVLRKTPLAKYLPNLDAKASGGGSYSKGCCSDASCNDGTGDVKTVQSLQHWKDLKRTEPLLVVDFTASWCKPCRAMAPIFESLAKENKGTAAVFAKVDIDNLPETFDGTSIPAFYVFKNGVKMDSVTGSGESKLRKLVADHVGQQQGDGSGASPHDDKKVQ
ncbi:unnamed protein product [Ectocarpus sp. 12 AP-2014]